MCTELKQVSAYDIMKGTNIPDAISDTLGRSGEPAVLDTESMSLRAEMMIEVCQ